MSPCRLQGHALLAGRSRRGNCNDAQWIRLYGRAAKNTNNGRKLNKCLICLPVSRTEIGYFVFVGKYVTGRMNFCRTHKE